MKTFWEDLGKIITETADTVVEKTSQAVEVQKLKSKVRIQERRIEKDYQNLGKIIYERYIEGEVLDSEYSDLCNDIQESKYVIKDLEEEIQKVQESEI